MRDIHKDLIVLVQKLWFSPFIRNVSVLVSGTAIAQGIGFVLLPLLSRIYLPSAFGEYALFLSVSGVIGSVSHLCYDQAVVLPRSDTAASAIFALGAVAAFVFGITTMLLGIAATLFPFAVFRVQSFSTLSWSVVLAVFVLLSTVSQLFMAWTIRKKAFKATAISNVGRALTLVSTQVLLGLYRPSALNLAIGTVLGELASIGLMVILHYKNNTLPQLRSNKVKEIRSVAVEYRDFPKYAAPQSLLNATSQGLPSLLLMNFFGATVVGYYSVSIRSLQSPMNLFLSPIRSVLLQRTSELNNRGTWLFPQFKRMTTVLALVTVIPSIGLFVFSPSLLRWYLGDSWGEAGIYARWLIIWFGVMFVNVPAIVTAQVLRRQRNLFIFDVFLLIFRLSALILGGLFLTASQTVHCFSLVGMAASLIIIYWVGGVARASRRVSA